MKTKLACPVALCVAIAHASAAAEMLAQKLPARTVLYAEVDVGRATERLMDYLRFIDREHADGVEFNTRTVIECLKELAAQKEFAPQAFGRLGEMRAYFVMMAKDEPEVKTHTYRTPKYDYEKGERIEGEFEEHTYTTRKDFTLSLVGELPSEEVAADFLEQFKALEERMHEDAGHAAWREVEVDGGEMIEDPSGGDVLGRLGRYIVFSDTKPSELWAALMAPADPSLAESAVYKRLRQGDEEPAGVFLVNLAVLIEKLQETLLRELEEAEEEYGPAAEDGEDGEYNQGAWRVQMARQGLDTFLVFEKLFSLDKLDAAGVGVGLSVGPDSAKSRAAAALYMGEPLSPVLELILDGGRQLEAPGIGKREGILIMARLGLKEILREVAEGLDPKYAGGIVMASAAMKAQVGYDLAEVLDTSAGDVYLYLDFAKKEQVRRRWDPEAEDVVTETVVAPAPEFLVLVGLEEAERLSEILSGVFTKLTGAGAVGAFLGKRSFLGGDVYVIGPSAGEEGVEPDGLTTFAAAVVGRHLAVGSWKDVTGLIRDAGAGADEAVAGVLARHRDANLLAVVPGSLNKKLRDMFREEGTDPMADVKKALEELKEVPIEDERLAERFRGSIERLIESFLAIAEKEQDRNAGAYGVGMRRGAFYEIRAQIEVKK